MAKVVILHEGQATPHELSGDRMNVGRLPECDLQLASNMVSRKHAEFIKAGDDWKVVDLESGNGTFVNGQRLTPHQPMILSHEDRVKVGPMLLRFESESGSKVMPVQIPADAGPQVDIVDDPAGSNATIMGAVDNSSGFGMLDVQPDVKLKAVIEISRSLAGTIDVEKLLPKILDVLFQVFPHADRGCILLKDDEGNMRPASQKHRREGEDATVKLSRTIVDKVLTTKQGLLSADAMSDSEFGAAESIASLEIRSMMCVPLLGLDGEPVGIINIDTSNPINQFKEEDLDLLLAVAGQAALSYEGARLFGSYVQKQKQDNEMRIARNVQEALLPTDLPEIDGYEFYASYDAAQAVGGDYYDCFQLPGKVVLSFGDVAGKGVPGALIMSRMASCVQNTIQFVHEVEPAVKAINNHMCANAVEGRFVTYVLAIIDLETNNITLINAGHMSPLIRRVDGEVDEFPEESIGIPVGILEDYPYEVVQRKIEPGEMVVLITDGVDEAMNPEGELYTKERVRDFISANNANAADLGRDLLTDVRRHADGRDQNDDITIMTFGRNAI